jgi:hypothetical protein
MPRKEKEYHYIYKTTNLKTGKFYIGMHSTDNLNDGYLGSGKRLRRSIRKNGIENFKLEILEFRPNRSSLKVREKELVNEDLLKNQMCMNLQVGGGGGFSGEKHREKFFIAAKKVQTSNLTQGRKTQAILWKSNEEWANMKRLKIKEGLRNIDFDHGSTFRGKTHSDETKKKIGEKNANNQKGEKNSQFGSCWITDGENNKKMKKTDQLPEGWTFGRK